MTSFDHRDRGTPASLWHRQLTELPAVELPESGGLIVLAAHPDDETLGAGGLIASAAHRGLAVHVLIATDGENSHPASRTHSPAQLAAIRRAEVRAAVSVLAPLAQVDFMSLPDGELSQHRADIEQALTGIIQTTTTDAGPLWVLSPWLGDRHPDHAVCAEAARAVSARDAEIRSWEYPIWLWHWGDPDTESVAIAAMRAFELSLSARQARDQALGCYRSQTEALSARCGDEPVLAPEFLAHFQRSYEVLIETTGAQTPASAVFGEVYARTEDPWGFSTRWYEQRKRQLLLASLPRQTFDRAFEPGCATGLLTVELARRCSAVLAVDVAARAVEQAQLATVDLPGVQVATMQIPDEWPEGAFDLIVLSEIGYYLDLVELCRRLRQSLTADGVLLVCHWRHPAPDHLHTAEVTHREIRSQTGLHVLASHVEEDFFLDVLTARSSSVARRDGIV